MHMYTRLIFARVVQLFLVTLCCVFTVMLSLLGFEQVMTMPESIPMGLFGFMLLYEWVHILCWVLPVTTYIALVLWCAQAAESQLLYRLFHAGWSRLSIYGVLLSFLLPWMVIEVALNVHYLPYARSQQRWLLEEAYQTDATLHFEGDRFHRLKLAGETWMIFFDQGEPHSLYAFHTQEDALTVIVSDQVATDPKSRQLVLRQGQRVHWSKNEAWPLSIWTYEEYGLTLPVLALSKDTDLSNYTAQVWDQPEANYRLEAYNRLGRILMMVILTWVPLLLVDGTEQRQKVQVFQRGLCWYVWYWILFILCRWALALDQYQHLGWALLPHGLMGASLLAYYYQRVRV